MHNLFKENRNNFSFCWGKKLHILNTFYNLNASLGPNSITSYCHNISQPRVCCCPPIYWTSDLHQRPVRSPSAWAGRGCWPRQRCRGQCRRPACGAASRGSWWPGPAPRTAAPAPAWGSASSYTKISWVFSNAEKTMRRISGLFNASSLLRVKRPHKKNILLFLHWVNVLKEDDLPVINTFF